jgi:hypothetical protein
MKDGYIGGVAQAELSFWKMMDKQGIANSNNKIFTEINNQDNNLRSTSIE